MITSEYGWNERVKKERRPQKEAAQRDQRAPCACGALIEGRLLIPRAIPVAPRRRIPPVRSGCSGRQKPAEQRAEPKSCRHQDRHIQREEGNVDNVRDDARPGRAAAPQQFIWPKRRTDVSSTPVARQQSVMLHCDQLIVGMASATMVATTWNVACAIIAASRLRRQ
jgi:hypothetical protein